MAFTQGEYFDIIWFGMMIEEFQDAARKRLGENRP